MNTRDVDVLLYRDFGLVEGLVGRRPIARLPVPDVVASLLSVAHFGRPRLQRLERVHHHRQRLVLDLDRGDAVGRGVAAGGDHGGDLLRLVLRRYQSAAPSAVAHQCRHPGQAVLVQVLAGDHGEHAGHFERAVGVDPRDPRVGIGAAHDVEVEHPRQLDVVDVIALAVDEARVFLALEVVAQPWIVAVM